MHDSNFFEDSFPNSARPVNENSFNVELNSSEQYTVDDTDVQNSHAKMANYSHFTMIS